MSESVLKYKAAAAEKADSATSANSANYLAVQTLTYSLLGSTSSFFFTVPGAAGNITRNSLTVPVYSKGLVITNGGQDAIIIGVDGTTLFVAFRNNGTWGARRNI